MEEGNFSTALANIDNKEKLKVINLKNQEKIIAQSSTKNL